MTENMIMAEIDDRILALKREHDDISARLDELTLLKTRLTAQKPETPKTGTPAKPKAKPASRPKAQGKPEPENKPKPASKPEAQAKHVPQNKPKREEKLTDESKARPRGTWRPITPVDAEDRVSIGKIIPAMIRQRALENGQITGAEIREMTGAHRTGPVLSGWFRQCRKNNLDFEDYLRTETRKDGKKVYIVTDLGRSALAG